MTTMDVQSEKIKLIEWLVGLKDISTLQRVSQVRNESVPENEKIVITTTSGKALSKSEYIAEVKSAEIQIENGDSMSHEAVKNAITQW